MRHRCRCKMCRCRPPAFCTTTSPTPFVGGAIEWRRKAQQASVGTRTEPMTCLVETSVSRRDVMRWAITAVSSYSLSGSVQRVEAVLNPFASPPDLVTRLKQRTSEEMTERLFEEDLFYPEFFAGTWRTKSTLLSVACPAGYRLFGRTGSFEEAEKGIGESVRYESRFVRYNGHVVADRAFNVKAIARATLGPYSVLQCEAVGNKANRVAVSLRPDGTDGSVYQVDLRTIARHQQLAKLPINVESAFRVRADSAWKKADARADDGLEDERKEGLYTCEVVRQHIRLDTDDLRAQPLIKHVETSVIFAWDDDRKDCFSAWQKTSTYLTRSSLMYVDARGRPVDVRWYKIEHSRS